MTIHNYAKTIEGRCDKDEDTGCWNWTRATHVQGYAFMRYGYKGMMTVQRIMAIELNLFSHFDLKTRITTTCGNKLCCNPDHIVCLSYTEILNKRYAERGTGGRFAGREREERDEYNKMVANQIPRKINILAHKYDCHESLVYRVIRKANQMDGIKD